LIKYAANAFLAVKVSYINEIADLCEAVGVDVHEVAKGIGLDRRIGRLFLHPGPGYGGSCFPKDTRAILATAAEHKARLQIVDAAVTVNDGRGERMVAKIRAALGGVLEGKTVALLGLAFKPNTDDVRESPAMAVAQGLAEAGCTVRAYDPAAMETARAAGFTGEACGDEYSACQKADALVIATEWNQFRNLDLGRIKEALRQPLLVDLRNIYEPGDLEKLGFRYSGVGR
jgi:UDPglucose 6-dehydrogenase